MLDTDVQHIYHAELLGLPPVSRVIGAIRRTLSVIRFEETSYESFRPVCC